MSVRVQLRAALIILKVWLHYGYPIMLLKSDIIIELFLLSHELEAPHLNLLSLQLEAIGREMAGLEVG